MSTGTFQYRMRVGVPLEIAAERMADLAWQARLHPLIHSVTEVPAGDGEIRRYVIRDRMTFGPIPLRTKYTAAIVEAGPRRVRTQARQRPGVIVENLTRLDPDDDATDIVTDITLRAPGPLFRYAISTAEAAHREMARRIEAELA